jgi:hypothetical protein
MTNPQSQGAVPLAAATAADLTRDDANTPDGTPVGASDADADAARSGADADLTDAQRDSDGVPVGREDAAEDARRSGADLD